LAGNHHRAAIDRRLDSHQFADVFVFAAGPQKNWPFLVIARSEATKQSSLHFAAFWIASLRSQ